MGGVVQKQLIHVDSVEMDEGFTVICFDVLFFEFL